MANVQELVPIKCTLPESVKNNFQLYVLSDCHIGDANCDMEVLTKIVDTIKNTPTMYCVLLGDIMNTALKASKSDIYTETMNVAQAQQKALELLSPIKDKILAITPGNHENRVWREVGVDITLWLAEKLGLESVYRNDGLVLTIQFGKDVNGKPYRFNVFGQHGAYGGGRKLGAAMNAIEDMDGIVGNADLYIRAHTHNAVQGSRKVFFVNEYGNMECKIKYYYNSPSVLRYTTNNRSSYAFEKGYKPCNDDPMYLNIRAVSSRQGSRVEKAFKVDKIML